ncbi:MAG: histidine kinase [Candidatus Reconcilbacillus cellulovorans]|uniref:histidine kinase n=1 Tax=Candidatus Reconcilbacillus cellulovorans TaxID=1906605 RepID=A0A2A6DZK6_9BACL|nr:MAG: histidine kinase [Candidatus Reconcilbacillus cellulovorans]
MKRIRFDNLPIRYKLITLFLLIGIVPSLGLALLVDWTVHRVVERQANDYAMQVIGKVSQSFEFYMNNIQNLTYLIAFNPTVRRFLADERPQREPVSADYYEMRRFLQEFASLYPEVAGILVADARGNYVSNDMYARTPRPLTEESWFRAAVAAGGIFQILGRPSERNVTTLVPYTDRERISAVRAVIDPDTQQTLGVILVDMKLRVVSETARTVRLGKSGFLTVIDERGEIVYAPAQTPFDRLPRDWFGPANSGVVTRQAAGQEWLLIYRTSPFTGWTTVGVFPKREPVEGAREIRFSVVTFVFLVCLLGLTASIYLSRSMSRPIDQLMSFMRQVESGNLSIRYRGTRTDEIGMLGRSFNLMLAQINRLLELTEIQERKKREAELRSLQAHIKPHFLYNTLDTIHWMARSRGADDIAALVGSLARLFRIGLSGGSDIIPLAEEFEHVRHYLNIQQIRYRNKLDYRLAMSDDVRDAKTLKLILQPIVENAIYHGIRERRGPGFIDVTAEAQDGCLMLRVRDDGKGMSPDRLAAVRSKLENPLPRDDAAAADDRRPREGGYGLANVQARIRLTFGQAYGIAVDSEEGVGTTVVVRLPLLFGEKGGPPA